MPVEVLPTEQRVRAGAVLELDGHRGLGLVETRVRQRLAVAEVVGVERLVGARACP